MAHDGALECYGAHELSRRVLSEWVRGQMWECVRSHLPVFFAFNTVGEIKSIYLHDTYANYYLLRILL